MRRESAAPRDRSARAVPAGQAGAGRRVQALLEREPVPAAAQPCSTAIAGASDQPVPGWRGRAPCASGSPSASASTVERGPRRRRDRCRSSHQLIQAAAGTRRRGASTPGGRFEAYPGLVTVAGATSVHGAEPCRPPPRPRRDGRSDHRPHPRRHRLHARTTRPARSSRPTSSTRSWRRCPTTVLVRARRGLRRVRHRPATPSTACRCSSRYPNLVVLRTFSKAYGLAGLRVGYAIGPAYILDAARATAIPLSVTEPAQRAAIAALDHEAAAARARRRARRAPRRDLRRRCARRAGTLPRAAGQLRLAADR